MRIRNIFDHVSKVEQEEHDAAIIMSGWDILDGRMHVEASRTNPIAVPSPLLGPSTAVAVFKFSLPPPIVTLLSRYYHVIFTLLSRYY